MLGTLLIKQGRVDSPLGNPPSLAGIWRLAISKMFYGDVVYIECDRCDFWGRRILYLCFSGVV